MNRLIFTLTILINLFFVSCKGQTLQTANNKDIDNYKSEILSEDEMKQTSDNAVHLIQEENYQGVKHLFARDIANSISDQQIIQLVDQINLLFKSEGVPAGNENIIPALNVSVQNGDTLFLNNIVYNFNPITNGGKTFSRVLTFSFLKKFGTKQLAGLNLNINPISSGNAQPTITKLEKLNFNVNDITRFRIYYDEGNNRRTKYKNEIGYFAVEGDAATLNKTRIRPFIETIFGELSKLKNLKAEPFNTTLNRGNAKFIQAEFGFKDKPYSIFIYLPIENGGAYSGNIIIMQREYANLGYEFTLNKTDYPKITSEFPKIASLNLDDFYLDKP